MLDSIATVILTGMMLIPVLNVAVGIIAGGGSFGLSGACAGGALGVVITLMQARWRARVDATPSSPAAMEFPVTLPAVTRPAA
jgi:hypothetical protein